MRSQNEGEPMTLIDSAIANLIAYRNLLQAQVGILEARIEAWREVKGGLPYNETRWHHADQRYAYRGARAEAETMRGKR